MKKLFLWLFKPLLGKKAFQPFFEKMHLIALFGQNYGLQGDFLTSGEKVALSFVLDKTKNIENPIIFDVGANVGNYSRLILSQFPQNYKVYSFEPSPNTFKRLKENVLQFKNCIPVNIGFSDIEGDFDLFNNHKNNTHASLIKRDMSHWGAEFNLDIVESVKITTLDSFCEKYQIDKIDFLKIDTEGFEYKLLLGAPLMRKQRKIPIIQFEFGVCAVDSKYFLKDMFNLLSKDYDIYRILKDGLYHLPKYHEKLEIFLTTNYMAILKADKNK